MTYRISAYTAGAGDTILLRSNDGALTIMRDAADDGDARPALTVPRVAEVSRKDRHAAPDAEQLSFANAVVNLLNYGAPVVLAALSYVDAVRAFREFERDNPNDSTKRWDAVFEAKNDAYDRLAAASDLTRSFES